MPDHGKDEYWKNKSGMSIRPTVAKKVCEYCDDKGEIEIDNNGPIVKCPVCKGKD